MSADVSTPEFGNTEHAGNEPSIWIRGLYMLLFIVITRVTEAVIFLIMLVQFIFKASKGNTNDKLERLGDQLSQYLYDIVQFQTFNTEDKPFPFAEWPESGKQ